MENITIVEQIENLKIGETQDWKFGLVTREVYRKSKNIFEIDDTSHGWLKAVVKIDVMKKLITGEIELTSLNWK
jgi:hypothetical protein